MGEPFRVETRKPCTEFIGAVEQTQGTETSKYLEEEKTTVIPIVAVSELGIAQTRHTYGLQASYVWGCGIWLEALAGASES